MFRLALHNERDDGLPYGSEAAMSNVSNCSRFETLRACDCKGYFNVGMPQCWLGDRCQQFGELLPLSSEQHILKTETVISPRTVVLSAGLQGMLVYATVVFLVLTYHCSNSTNENRNRMERKVKYPRYRPTWPRAVQEVKAPRFRHSAHEGGKIVTPTHRPPLPPVISSYSFLEAHGLVGCFGKTPSNTTGDRSRDIPTGSAAP